MLSKAAGGRETDRQAHWQMQMQVRYATAAEPGIAHLSFYQAVLQLLIDCHSCISRHGPGRCGPDGQGCSQTALPQLCWHLPTFTAAKQPWRQAEQGMTFEMPGLIVASSMLLSLVMIREGLMALLAEILVMKVAPI